MVDVSSGQEALFSVAVTAQGAVYSWGAAGPWLGLASGDKPDKVCGEGEIENDSSTAAELPVLADCCLLAGC